MFKFRGTNFYGQAIINFAERAKKHENKFHENFYPRKFVPLRYT